MQMILRRRVPASVAIARMVLMPIFESLEAISTVDDIAWIARKDNQVDETREGKTQAGLVKA
jgi:hypothetical protein